ncbi:hypothetical protein [Ferrigenium kumadai]|nr:hypothetical protein [Ferrigenium kumadai]
MKPKTQRMFSGNHRYHKVDIARGQLETAIRLFLVDGCNMFSAITLAAAAGEILHGLVLNAGKEPFVDYVIKVNDFRKPGDTPKRSSVISHIHNLLFVNALKHHDKKTEAHVEFDAEECALAAILKAIVDYETLTGEHTEAMKTFLTWTKLNLNSERIMSDFEKAPDHFKKL